MEFVFYVKCDENRDNRDLIETIVGTSNENNQHKWKQINLR